MTFFFDFSILISTLRTLYSQFLYFCYFLKLHCFLLAFLSATHPHVHLPPLLSLKFMATFSIIVVTNVRLHLLEISEKLRGTHKYANIESEKSHDPSLFNVFFLLDIYPLFLFLPDSSPIPYKVSFLFSFFSSF